MMDKLHGGMKLILLAGLVGGLVLMVAGVNSATGGGISYNHYQYNYPHQLPADYVFRTGRVFSPRELGPAGGLEQGPAPISPDPTPSPLAGAEIAGLVAELLAASREDLRGEYTLAVTTPVNLANLYATSSFGRVLAERLLGQLQRAGVEVADVRKTPALLVSQRHGEYGLSRDLDELPYVWDVQGVLVGTYTVTGARVLLDLRVLRNDDGRVLAAASRNFDMNGELAALLADESSPPRAAVPVAVRSPGEVAGKARPGAEGVFGD